MKLFKACVNETNQKWMAVKMLKENNSLSQVIDDDLLGKLLFEGIEDLPDWEQVQFDLLKIISDYSNDYKGALSSKIFDDDD